MKRRHTNIPKPTPPRPPYRRTLRQRNRIVNTRRRPHIHRQLVTRPLKLPPQPPRHRIQHDQMIHHHPRHPLRRPHQRRRTIRMPQQYQLPSPRRTTQNLPRHIIRPRIVTYAHPWIPRQNLRPHKLPQPQKRPLPPLQKPNAKMNMHPRQLHQSALPPAPTPRPSSSSSLPPIYLKVPLTPSPPPPPPRTPDTSPRPYASANHSRIQRTRPPAAVVLANASISFYV